MSSRLRPGPHFWRLVSLFPALLLAACGKKPAADAAAGPQVDYRQFISKTATEDDLGLFTAVPVGAEVGDKPWIAHVRAVDLDQDGLMDFIACDSKYNTVVWLRQASKGTFEELTIGENMRAPVHAEAVDKDGDGDLDVIVSSMSVVFPNNDKIGAIFILEQVAKGQFQPHLIIDNIDRVTDVRAADFDGDGKMDLGVGQFGYDQGEVRWMRRTGPWTFESHVLLELSGTINVCIADFDGDGFLDMAALVSQQWEEVHLFRDIGRPSYSHQVIWGSTNEDYSCSGMTMADLDKDGRMDLIFTNGDGFGPAAEPGPKPWHGVQWLKNVGYGRFEFKRIGDLAGAYSPLVVDLDRDGNLDVVAVSAFNDWSDPKAISMAWFRNDGKMHFQRRILAYQPTHLLTVDAAQFGGNGKPWLVTGAFHAYPPYEHQSRLLLWKPSGE